MPAPPVKVSLPARPAATSSPAVPTKLSLPAVPTKLLATTPVAAVVNCSRLPPPSVKLTTARSRLPTCAAAGVKLANVAPAMAVHGPAAVVADSQR